MAVDPKTVAEIAKRAKQAYDWLASKGKKGGGGKGKQKIILIIAAVVILIVALVGGGAGLAIFGLVILLLPLLLPGILCLAIVLTVVYVLCCFTIPVYYIDFWHWPPSIKCYELRLGEAILGITKEEFDAFLKDPFGEKNTYRDKDGNIKTFGGDFDPPDYDKNPPFPPAPNIIEPYKKAYPYFYMFTDNVKQLFGNFANFSATDAENLRKVVSIYSSLLITSIGKDTGCSADFVYCDVDFILENFMSASSTTSVLDAIYAKKGTPLDYNDPSVNNSISTLTRNMQLESLRIMNNGNYNYEPALYNFAGNFFIAHSFTGSDCIKDINFYPGSWPAILQSCNSLYGLFMTQIPYLELLLKNNAYFPFSDDIKTSKEASSKWYKFPERPLFKDEYFDFEESNPIPLTAMLFASAGTEILVPESCKIIDKGNNDRYGTYVELQSKSSGLHYFYFNMKDVNLTDQNVNATSTIGHVGAKKICSELKKYYLLSDTINDDMYPIGIRIYMPSDLEKNGTQSKIQRDPFLALRILELNKAKKSQ